MPLPFRSLTADHTDHNDSHLIIAGVTVLLSVLIHTGIGVAAGDARLDFFSPKTVHPEAWREGLRDEPVRARIVQPPPTQEQFAETVERADLEPRERPPEEDPVTLLAAADTEAPATLFEPPPTAQGIGEAMSAGISPPATPDVAESVTPWTPRETVLEIASRFANDDLAAIARKEVPSIERVSNAPDIAPPQTVSVTLEGRGDSLIAKYAMPQPGRGEMAVPAAMLEVTPAEEPESLPLEPISHEEEVSRFIAEAPEDVAPATPIENVLAPSIQVYRPARDDGYVYFRVDIRRKGADVLPPIPRDILFVQDASASLSAQRLHYCNLAIQQILDSDIRPTDRINVLAFNTTNSYAFGKAWAPATPKNIEIAKAFTQNIRADREHRLYQSDWLVRKYGFSAQELLCNPDGFLDRTRDPKRVWADAHPEYYPVRLNTAPREVLLRVPGIGPVAANAILKLRAIHPLRDWSEVPIVPALAARAHRFAVFS